MTRVLIVRHGEPQETQGQARSNWPLSRFGRNQSDHMTDRLLEYGSLNVVSSPVPRCKQTAEIVAKRLGKSVRIDQRLGEISAPQGQNFEEWVNRTFQTSNGTTWSQLDASLRKWRDDNLQAVRELKEPTVVVTQYANINAIFGAALRIDATGVCRPDYASITEFSVVNGDIRLVVDGKEVVGPNE